MPQAWIYGKVRALTTAIKAQNVSCIWVGPPWGTEGASYMKTDARVREMSDFLAQAVAPCIYIDSTVLSRPDEWPTIDGQHLAMRGYRAWGEGIADSIVSLVGRRRTEGNPTFPRTRQ